MPATLTPQQFVSKWRRVAVKERSGYQEHFLDLCALVGHPTPLEADPKGQSFTFEAGAKKLGGEQGWADVWKRGFFAIEYKGKFADLTAAYRQLLEYRENLDNPPLLIVCDLENFVIHPQFVNAANATVTLTLDDLLTQEGMAQLRAVFQDPERFHAMQTPAQVTERAAKEFARLADQLRKAGVAPQEAAHFLIRLLFCLFAEDVGLLPRDLFTRLVQTARSRPAAFTAQLAQLFAAMSAGGWFGTEEIKHFDGGLFDDARALALDAAGLDILAGICGLNWAAIEPSILGTLFERSLDPGKRAQLGAHYTGRADIALLMEPVLMAPLRHRWDTVRAQAVAQAEKRDAAITPVQMPAAEKAKRTRFRDKCNADLTALLTGFVDEIAAVQVLDPACGSGNFLYVALRQLLDLEHEVIVLAAALDLTHFTPRVHPAQLHGIEINEYAHELAQATIWIGYLQWFSEHGFGASEPILRPLHNILHMDAILADGRRQMADSEWPMADGGPDHQPAAISHQRPAVEPEWPAADVIIGNPPFLGDKKMRAELGDQYVDDLRALYAGRIPGQSDLVCYWFEKARAQIADGKAQRSGLLATQGIRGGANRRVLERIKETGDIFWAQSDRDWILDGANVHVSMVGFDGGTETMKVLNGREVDFITPNLTDIQGMWDVRPLEENEGLSFIGTQKGGAFEITEELALKMIRRPLNPNGRPNSDVVLPWANGLDVGGRPRGKWIVYFRASISEDHAALYEAPFQYLLEKVKPIRDSVRSESRSVSHWWQHQRPRPEMYAAMRDHKRYIATVRHSKHRLFIWLNASTVPDSALVVFAREDDYFFGVLHSRVHEVWARAMGTQLREVESGFRYTPTTTFETFPFPWPPGAEPPGDPRVQAIAAAARELVQLRDAWLNPPGASEAELKKRTLTNLYNQRPAWLDLAHKKLDAAVLDAYQWPHALSDEDLLARLLALNLARAGAA